ncbi:MAG TPA: hypothetical protein VF663_09345 [Telluria sp.]|jgi:hypothetical protein
MRTVRNKLGLAAVIAVTAGTLFALMTRGQPPVTPVPAAVQPAAPGLQWLQATGPAPAGAPVAAPMAPLAEQIDRLIATRDPARAYAAYQLLADCISFNRDGDRIVFEDNRAHRGDIRALSAFEKTRDALLCAGMTERMRQSRLDYLAFAAQAGVPGSAVAMATEGPFGDRTALATRPGDSLVQQWKADVNAQLARAGDGGDLDALHYLTGMRKNGDALLTRDAEAAYRYGLALGMIERQVNGPDDVVGKLYRADSALMREMAAELSDGQRADAVAAAGRIAEAHRARWKAAATEAPQP